MGERVFMARRLEIEGVVVISEEIGGNGRNLSAGVRGIPADALGQCRDARVELFRQGHGPGRRCIRRLRVSVEHGVPVGCAAAVNREGVARQPLETVDIQLRTNRGERREQDIAQAVGGPHLEGPPHRPGP